MTAAAGRAVLALAVQAVGDDDVGHAGFVFEVDEGDAGGGGGALPVGDDAGHPDPGAVVGLMEVGGGQCVDLLGGDPDPPDQVSHRRIQAIGVAFSDNLLGVLSPIDRTSVRPRRTA
jgi:hypothetical protein